MRAPTIDSADLLPNGNVRVQMRNDDPAWGDQNGRIAIVVIELANGHMRSIQSASPDGQQWIRDGIVVSNGQPAPSFEKCSG